MLALRRQGWSKSKLGRALGISQASISQLTNGKYPGAHHLPRIAKLLDVPEEWLRTGYPEPPWVPSLIISTGSVEPAGKPDLPAKHHGRKAKAQRDDVMLARRLKETERERDDLRDRVRRLEATVAWQADQLREIQDRRATTPDVSAG